MFDEASPTSTRVTWTYSFKLRTDRFPGSLAALFVLTRPAERSPSSTKVTFAQARGVIQARCTACHSQHPTDDVWKAAPTGIMFDTPEQMKALAARIGERAAVNKTMPLGNKTQMTDPERELVGAWVDQGASTD